MTKSEISTIRKYFFSCFLLTIPILVWNLALTNKLPKAFQSDVFWNDIPSFLTYGENISRTLVFMLTLFMPLSFVTPTQKKGVILFVTGTLIYFTSWIILIYFPTSKWSNSLLGFLSPSLTPLLWLMGIGFIGQSFYFNLLYRRWVFVVVSIVFLLFHNAHTLIVFDRTH